MHLTAHPDSPRAAFWGPALLLLAMALSAQAAGGSMDALGAIGTGVAVFLGCAALGWLRPASVGITAPQAMMLLSAVGMLLGLALDARHGGLGQLASLCFFASTAPDFAALLALHFEWMPAMHVGMVAGGLAAIPLLRIGRKHCRRQLCARLAQNLACSACMIVGMTAGTLAAHRFSPGSGSSAMLASMFVGMVWGMVASVTLYRAYFRCKGLAPEGCPSSALARKSPTGH